MQSLQMDCILSRLRHFLHLKASLPLHYGPLSLTAPLSLLLEALAVHVLHCVTCFSVIRGAESFKGSCRLQGSVYVILPPTTAITGYIIGFRRLVTFSPTTSTIGYTTGFRRLVTLSPASSTIGYTIGFRRLVILAPTTASATTGYIIGFQRLVLPPTTPTTGYTIGFQRLVILPPTTATIGYIIGFWKLVRWLTVFCCVQVAVSL